MRKGTWSITSFYRLLGLARPRLRHNLQLALKAVGDDCGPQRRQEREGEVAAVRARGWSRAWPTGSQQAPQPSPDRFLRFPPVRSRCKLLTSQDKNSRGSLCRSMIKRLLLADMTACGEAGGPAPV